jgi:hypothetical protein
MQPRIFWTSRQSQRITAELQVVAHVPIVLGSLHFIALPLELLNLLPIRKPGLLFDLLQLLRAFLVFTRCCRCPLCWPQSLQSVSLPQLWTEDLILIGKVFFPLLSRKAVHSRVPLSYFLRLDLQ